MNRREIIVILTGLFIVPYLYAQNNRLVEWTLQDCIDYAHVHNISLQQGRISLEGNRIDTKEAKAQLFPSLSFSTSHSYLNNPFISEENTSHNLYNGSYGVDASWTIFDGGKRTSTIKQQKLQEKVGQYDLDETSQNIELSILSNYLQILYAEESVRINEQTVEVSASQKERSKALLDAGSISRSDYAQIESQYSNDKYQLVTSQATLEGLKLDLKQLLELGMDDEMKLASPELDNSDILKPLPDKKQIYETALSFIPSIQSSKINNEIAELSVSKAKAGYWPSLSLNAGIGTSSLSGTGTGFGTQLKNKLNEQIGLTLSIPIYNNRSTRSSVEKARLQVINSNLELQNQQKELLKKIENAYLDARSAQNKYMAAQENVKSAQATYELVEEQFYVGIKNTLEMLTAKNNLLSARQEEIQSNYLALLNIKLLDYYNNEPITLE